MAESHPAVPVLTQGQQLEGTHCRSVHVSEKWVRMDQSVPASGSGRAMLTRLVAAQWQQVGRAPGLSPGAVLTPTGVTENPLLPKTERESVTLCFTVMPVAYHIY